MGPLAGFKIIEIKGIGPGPYAGQVLADLGAEVIVVERASKPNSIALPSAMDVNSRGKKSIALDLRKPEGLDALLKLVKNADGIFEGNRPGVAERLGFGPDVCLQCNPKIVYGRMTGWGQSGPLAHTAGHDYNYISLSGAAAAIGTTDRPVPPLNVVGDFAGGSLFLVIGMLSALLESSKSGKGQVVDAAITDGTSHLMSVFHSMDKLGLFSPNREANLLDGGAPYYKAYATSDNKFLSVAPIEPQFFAEMIQTLGLPDRFAQEQNNPKIWPELTSALTDVFKTKTRDEWVNVFEGSDACVAGILTLQEAAEHPHNKARGNYIEVNGITQPAPAPRFSRSQHRIPEPPSAEGADTKAVLSDWGFDEDTLAALEQAGVFT